MQLWRGPHAFKVNAWPLYMPYILAVGITLSVCLLQLLVWKDTSLYKTNVEHISAYFGSKSLIFKNNARLKFRKDVRISEYSICNPTFRCSFALSIQNFSFALAHFHDVVKHQERLEYRLLIFRLS